jgi:hypothetical protein
LSNHQILQTLYCPYALKNVQELENVCKYWRSDNTVAINKLLCLKNAGAQISMFFISNEYYWYPWQLKKIKILEIGPNGLNWQCCLAGSFKTAPRILIFSFAMCAKTSILAEIHCYLSALKS